MNVLLLVVDALRADYLGCYGSKQVETPTIDHLAEGGLRFHQTIASSTWTPSCTSALITGIYPHRLGVYTFNQPLPEKTKTLFHYFKDSGYAVSSFVFDEKYLFTEIPEANVIGNFRDFLKPLQWLKNNKHKPFFLYIHYYWTHGPYEPQVSAFAWSEANQKLLRSLREDSDGAERAKTKYRMAVKKMSEEWLAQIIDELERNNIRDKTLLVFTADHGESWGERYKDKSKIIANFHLHGELLYDELLRIPLIISNPCHIKKGRTIPNQISQVDIAPTILEITNLIPSAKHWPMDGSSLLRFLKEDQVKDESCALSSTTFLESASSTGSTVSKFSLRKPPWKLIWNIREGSKELYNLDLDPEEKTDISRENRETVRKMMEVLKKEYDKASHREPSKDEFERMYKQLKNLGYV